MDFLDMIDHHNEVTEEMMCLLGVLQNTYGDIEGNPADNQFFEVLGRLYGEAQHLCCEANAKDERTWMVTLEGFVRPEEDVREDDDEARVFTYADFD